MKRTNLALISIAAAFSIGVANADAPRAAEVIIVTAPKPQPIDSLAIAPPAEVKPDIDYTNLRIEPPRLDPPGTRVERRAELALNGEAKTKT